MANTKSPTTTTAQLALITQQLSDLRAALPLSVGHLTELAALQTTLARACKHAAAPAGRLADDIAEALCGDETFIANLADALASRLAVKLAPLQPFILELMKAGVGWAAAAGSEAGDE